LHFGEWRIKMGITCRRYKDIGDYERICKFLEGTYSSYGTRFDNNITLFEFQCALSCGYGEVTMELEEVLKDAFLWFDNEELVGILENDSFCVATEYRVIFDNIVSIRETVHSDFDRDIEWSIYEGDYDFESVLSNKNYYKTDEYWVRRYIDLATINIKPSLPEGFSVESIPNLSEHDRVYTAYKLCYGILFNKNILDNFYKTSTYRKELDLVVVDADRRVVALCSSRYDEKNKMVSIEAVSCYHEYRNMGISKALLVYTLNVAKMLGAKKVTVFTAMPEKYPAPNKLYESVGFKIVGNLYVWKRSK
jgi:N-acetylglutamate synthase-like GNAT family acetyltransferase